MLIDHEIRIAQVFKLEGNLDEATRQKILAKTRGKLLAYYHKIQAEIIESLSEVGAKTAGKVRHFAQVFPYEAPEEAEWEPVNVQGPLQQSGAGASNCSIPVGDDDSGSSSSLEGSKGDDMASPEAVESGDAEAKSSSGSSEAK